MSFPWKRAALMWGPVVVYMAAIFLISANPTPPPPPVLEGYDKCHHFLAYFGLGLVVLRAAILMPLTRIGPYWFTAVLGLLYGASDEFHQLWVPNRIMSFADWLSDTAGILAAIALTALIRRMNSSKGGILHG